MPPPEVEVALPVMRDVIENEDFSGETDAVETVDIRSRVTGYLDKVHFKHGVEVAEGTPLFQIDPRPYDAELRRTEAVISQGEARLKRLNADYRRAETLRPSGTVTQEQFDLIVADREEALATIKAAKAQRDMAALNLKFTKITAPIHGRLSRPFIDVGNLVKGDETILTRIVSLDPMFVYFDIDERTMLRLNRLHATDASRSAGAARSKPIKVLMGLVDEQGYPHEGTLDFSENRVDAGTGTLRVRAVSRSRSAAGPRPVRAGALAGRQPPRRSWCPSERWAPTRARSRLRGRRQEPGARPARAGGPRAQRLAGRDRRRGDGREGGGQRTARVRPGIQVNAKMAAEDPPKTAKSEPAAASTSLSRRPRAF